MVKIINYQLDWVIKLPVSEIIILVEHDLYRQTLGESYKGMPIKCI